jgi:hypothetical protein
MGAAQFGVTQASIREAVNILAQAGFVTKVPGRRARVIQLSETDVGQMYLIRGAIENAFCPAAVCAGCVAGGSVTLAGCTAGPLAVAAKRQMVKKVCTSVLQVFAGQD